MSEFLKGFVVSGGQGLTLQAGLGQVHKVCKGCGGRDSHDVVGREGVGERANSENGTRIRFGEEERLRVAWRLHTIKIPVNDPPRLAESLALSCARRWLLWLLAQPNPHTLWLCASSCPKLNVITLGTVY